MDETRFVFTGFITKEDCKFSAICPEVDVATDGASHKEAKNNLVEAVSLYVETAVENNLPILRPIPQDEHPKVAVPSQITDEFPIKVDFSVKAYA